MNQFFHSVYLDPELCKGCINCIKRCPTQAIRVRNGKAHITSKFCIDCGVCVRICSHHAKLITRDQLDILDNYQYTVALPAPSLYGQFNNLEDVNIVLTALTYLGFDDVYEVSGAAELVSQASRDYVQNHPEKWPLISTACPSVVRLIRVRFPNLIDHLMPIKPPIEIAAILARQRAMKRTGLPKEQIGIVFISPCPSKVTYIKSPLGSDHTEVDGVLAIKDIYPALVAHMKEAQNHPKDLSISGRIGIGWGGSGGEAGGLITDNYLAAAGIENVTRVLEDLEDEKFTDTLQFIELNACNAGCVGGALTVENPYMAKAKLQRIRKYMPVSKSRLPKDRQTPCKANLYWNQPVTYQPVFQLSDNIIESISRMKQVDSLCKLFPDLDCGSCGAPTCKALAEDIVRGEGKVTDCIHILKNHIHELSTTFSGLAKEAISGDVSNEACVAMLQDYLERLTKEIALLDTPPEE